jgi:hypothetical protein
LVAARAGFLPLVAAVAVAVELLQVAVAAAVHRRPVAFLSFCPQ